MCFVFVVVFCVHLKNPNHKNLLQQQHKKYTFFTVSILTSFANTQTDTRTELLLAHFSFLCFREKLWNVNILCIHSFHFQFISLYIPFSLQCKATTTLRLLLTIHWLLHTFFSNNSFYFGGELGNRFLIFFWQRPS